MLYLLLNAYEVKKFLNESEEIEPIIFQVEGIVPDIDKIFHYWSKKYAKNSLKINPKMLNKIYRKISLTNVGNKNNYFFEDYNAIVDTILHISPSYKNSNEVHHSESEEDVYEPEKKKKLKTSSSTI